MPDFSGILTGYRLVALVVLVLAAATAFSWLSVRFRRRSVRYVPVGLMARRYVVWYPIPRRQPKPVPVVLAFHDHGSTVEQFEKHSAFHLARAAASFAVIYPEGYHQSWNAGRCCGDAMRSRIDDVKFVRTILDDLEAQLAIDRQRIYATGFANGAMLCCSLARKMSDQIAAVAPVNDTATFDCAPAKCVPVLKVQWPVEEQARAKVNDAILEFFSGKPSSQARPHRRVRLILDQGGSGSINQ